MQSSNQRPDHLTSEFIRLLYEGKGTQTGYFQIIEYHQKKQKYYSTHISDGFYKTKVFFKEKPANQIDKGEIKLFSILYGSVYCQGDRIFMVFKELKCWDFPRTVGMIKNWKFQSVNNYLHGDNFIQWFQQKTQEKINIKGGLSSSENENETDSIVSLTPSELLPRRVKERCSLDSSSEKGIEREGNKDQSKVVENLKSEPFSFARRETSEIDSSLVIQKTQSLSIRKQNRLKEGNTNQSKKLQIVSETQSDKNNSNNKKKLENSPTPKEISKIEISMAQLNRISQVQSDPDFDFLQKKHKSKFIESQKKNQEDKGSQIEEDDMEQLKMQLKKVRDRMIERIEVQQTKEIIKETLSSRIIPKSQKKSTFQLLVESDQQQDHNSETDYPPFKTPSKITPKITLFNEDYFEEIKYESKEKLNSYYRLSNRLKYHELDPGEERFNRDKSWMMIYIYTIKFFQQNSCQKLLVVCSEWVQSYPGNIFNMILSNGSEFNPFEESQIYQLSLMNLSFQEPNIKNLGSEIEIRGNSQQIKCRKIDKLKIGNIQAKKDNFSISPIIKLFELRENILVNIVGIVYGCRNIALKNKFINIVTIIDPFSKTSIDLTTFDQKKINILPDTPILLFNGVLKIYKGKMQLNLKNISVLLNGSDLLFPRYSKVIYQLDMIRKWVTQSNSVNNIIKFEEKYGCVSELSQIVARKNQKNEQLFYVQTPIVRILQISPFYFKLICDSCSKNMIKNSYSCYQCGKRENPIKELKLTLLVGDNSFCEYVQFNHYESALWIGPEGERFQIFKNEMMHKRVKLWIDLNPKYRSLGAKMKKIQEQDILKNEIGLLRNLKLLI